MDREHFQLTGQDEDDINNLVQMNIFQSLSNEDLDISAGVGKDEVLDLYRKYYLADKTVGQLTE